MFCRLGEFAAFRSSPHSLWLGVHFQLSFSCFPFMSRPSSDLITKEKDGLQSASFHVVATIVIIIRLAKCPPREIKCCDITIASCVQSFWHADTFSLLRERGNLLSSFSSFSFSLASDSISPISHRDGEIFHQRDLASVTAHVPRLVSKQSDRIAGKGGIGAGSEFLCAEDEASYVLAIQSATSSDPSDGSDRRTI